MKIRNTRVTLAQAILELQLVIEVDGEPHRTPEGMEHDRRRDRYLASLGYRILRIPGYEVLREDSNVAARIERFVRQAIAEQAPLPGVPGRGELVSS
ncbi:MAG: DUF559 domain-containing protein [Planctomycetales bacterium]|nr:DUF559 domain-containing protein [Planctomycetales bacterium]